MKNLLKKILEMPNVFIVSLFAIVAYMLTALFITQNTIQYSSLPATVTVQVRDNYYSEYSPNKNKSIVLKVKSKLPIDSIDKANKASALKPVAASGSPVIKDILYHQNPVFLVWLILICIMMAIAAGSFPIFINQILDLRREFNLGERYYKKAIGYALALTLFLIVTNGSLKGYYKPPYIIENFKILFSNSYVPLIIVSATILLVSPVFTLIFLVGLATARVKDNQTTQKGIEQAVKNISILNTYLQNSLQVLAIIVVFSVLTSSALGETIRSTLQVEGFELYPKQTSYVYGLYFTLFLCIIYIPVYFFIKQKYNKIKDTAYTLSTDDDDKHSKWYDKHFGTTKFEGTAIDNLKLALTVLSPLLSAFLPGTLGLIK